MSTRVRIEIAEDGKVAISVNGVKGPGCMALTKELEGAFGRPKSRRKTAEYHQKGRERGKELA